MILAKDARGTSDGKTKNSCQGRKTQPYGGASRSRAHIPLVPRVRRNRSDVFARTRCSARANNSARNLRAGGKGRTSFCGNNRRRAVHLLPLVAARLNK